MKPPGSAAGSAIETVVATGTPSAGSSATGDVASAADVIAALPPDAAVAEVTPPAIDAAVAVVPPDAAAVVLAPPPPPPPPAPKPEPPKPVHHETPVAAHHAEPARVAHAEPSHPRMSQGDVDAAYKQGLQLYMRGDTEGALASLRAALAGNPGYPPTWRGLGLVYEKLNEKDQARAAYRKYLQLAPNAGDADKIRNRLERL
jgi:TolA-binding protein